MIFGVWNPDIDSLYISNVKFSQDLTQQKSLKSVNFWQSYWKNKRWTFFGIQCMYVCLSDDNFRKPWFRWFFHVRYISTVHGSSSYMKVTRLMSRSREHKKLANACSCIDQLRSAIFIGTRQMAPQTTRRGWSGLRLEGKTCLFTYRIVSYTLYLNKRPA